MNAIEPITFCIITPSHNAFVGLLRIYNEIRCILSSEIVWYIKDSGDCEKTNAYFTTKRHIYLDTRPDEGIYDAINIALASNRHSHYLVLGADDSIDIDVFEEALVRLRKAPEYPFHFYRIRHSQTGNIVSYKNLPLKWSNASIMPSHSAGTIISRLAHDRFGAYSTEFRILGDAYFVLDAIKNGAAYIRHEDILGSFELGGISSEPSWLRVCEWYLYQSKIFSKYSLVLYLFFLIRVIQLWVFLLKKKWYAFWY